MSAADRVRRILVAIDPGAGGIAALDVPGALAAALGADLEALFVERQDLLDLAGFPGVRAFSASAADHRTLDRDEMLRALRVQAEALARAMTALGARHRVAANLAAAQACDLVVLARRGDTRRSLGATVRATLAGAPCAVLVLPPRATAIRRVVALADGGPHVVARAATMAAALGVPLGVAVPSEFPDGDRAAVLRVHPGARIEKLADDAPEGLAALLAVQPDALVVLGRAPDLDARLARLDQPVLVVE
jgi:hypothetical protein